MSAHQPIDQAWWNTEYIDGVPMRDALAERDIKAVFQFLHKRGWSWGAIAQATDIGEQRVREIASGKRRVENYDVYVRVAVGLNIPRGYLGVGLRDDAVVGVVTGAIVPVSASSAELTATLRNTLECDTSDDVAADHGRAAAGNEFKLWDGSSRRIQTSLDAGAAGVVATPLCAFDTELPAKEAQAVSPMTARITTRTGISFRCSIQSIQRERYPARSRADEFTLYGNINPLLYLLYNVAPNH